MVKTKKKNIHAPLVIAGYTLFALLTLGTLASTTIPLGLLLFNPDVLHLNVSVMLVAFTVGTLLPMFVGYVIGNHAIKSRSKMSHHFTGILFGLLAYWVMTLLAVLVTIPLDNSTISRNVGLIVNNLYPSIAVAGVAVVVSIMHMRSRAAHQDILTYRPFSMLFITAIIVLPLWSLVQNIMTNAVNVYSFMPLLMVAVVGGLSYTTLRKVKLGVYDKVVWSSVSISVLVVAMFVVSQCSSAISDYILRTPLMETQILMSWFAFAVALGGWGVYWAKQVSALKNGR